MGKYTYLLNMLNNEKIKILNQIDFINLKQIKIGNQNNKYNADETEDWILQLRIRISDIDAAIIEFS